MNLAGATLTAPYAGTVSAIGINVGEQAGAGTAAITLVDTRQARVDVVVDETDVAKVQPGQSVTLTFEALPGQRVQGRVAVIAPVATVQQGVVNYPVQIQVDPAQAAQVRPGMTSTATIVTERKADVVVVPNRALRTQGRARTVEVMGADGKAEPRPVQTGMANDQMTEIIGGLQPGERVVIPSTTTATTGVRGPVTSFGPGMGGPPQQVIVRGG
jgi:RND family efflux transporter MFP subunit